MVCGSQFRAQGLEFRAHGLGLRCQGLGVVVHSLPFRVWVQGPTSEHATQLLTHSGVRGQCGALGHA